MRTALPGPTVLPLATRSVGRFVAADAAPVVTSVTVDHADAAGAVPVTVSACTDLGGSPLPGLYRVTVDTTAVALGSRVDVQVRSTLSGRALDTVCSWIVGDGEFVDASPPGPPNDPLSALDDDFADGSIDPAWFVDPEGATINEGAGFLEILPGDNAGAGDAWYSFNRAPLVAKEVTGDFRVTADVVISNDNGSALPPALANRWTEGGLILVDLAALPEQNTVGVAIGMYVGAYGARVHTTDDEFSTYWTIPPLNDQGGQANAVETPAYEIVPNPGAVSLTARLRLSRVGQTVRSEVSLDGGSTWFVDQTIDRSQAAPYDSGLGTPVPLGPSVFVGLQANAFATNPTNFRARFPSGITFETL